MKVTIIEYPGSFAIKELLDLLGKSLGLEAAAIWHNEQELPQTDLVILPSGSSFGDYLRPGAFARTSPMTRLVRNHAQSGGKVIGIGNGFQILTELGLLPGMFHESLGDTRINQTAHLVPATKGRFFSTPFQENQVLRLPVNAKYGRYVLDTRELNSLRDRDCIAFYYCDAEGNRSSAEDIFGCTNSIAAVYNQSHSILGIMAHPERALDPLMGSVDGRLFFTSI
ncbi:MAG: phosphoribosylformylglycinamidine synthase I [bacterium]|nr:phosphoribosylformylglycinamidine synthase I [bacterium]